MKKNAAIILSLKPGRWLQEESWSHPFRGGVGILKQTHMVLLQDPGFTQHQMKMVSLVQNLTPHNCILNFKYVLILLLHNLPGLGHDTDNLCIQISHYVHVGCVGPKVPARQRKTIIFTDLTALTFTVSTLD